jgi:hypothetical protein
MTMGEEEKAQLDLLGDQPVAGAIRRIKEHPTFRPFEGVAVRFKNSAGKASVFDHFWFLICIRALGCASERFSRETFPLQTNESRPSREWKLHHQISLSSEYKFESSISSVV